VAAGQHVIAGARAIYQAETRRQAIATFVVQKRRRQGLYRKAVACLEKDLDALLCPMDYPDHLWAKLHTTNAIERCFREVRRGARPMSAFSMTRAVTASPARSSLT